MIRCRFPALALLLPFLTGCFQYQPLPDSAAALERLDFASASSPEIFCNRAVAESAPAPEIFLRKSQCAQTEAERCKWFLLAARCGYVSQTSHPEIAARCGVNDTLLKASFTARTGTTFFASGAPMRAVCGYSEELTGTGMAIAPIGVIIGVPVFIVTAPIVCLVHPQKCKFQ